MKTQPEHFGLSFRATIVYYSEVLSGAKEIGDEALRQAKRNLGRTDLFFLLCYILKRYDALQEWIFIRCREVQADPDGHLDLWARGHYKSTVITFALTLMEIINDPEITIGIFSHTKSVSRKFLSQIKSEMEQNPELPRLWPEIFWADPKKQAPKWSEDGGIIVQRESNPKEATIEAHGLVDGQPTSRHFKLRVYDDVVTLESVSTPDQIQKTTDALRMSDNLGSKGGRERYIGTPYHMFDTYRSLIDAGIVIPRKHPATKNGAENGDPVLLSREELLDKRKKQGPYVFSAQMLINPVADTAMGFDRRWLTLADTDAKAAMRFLWRFILVDPAGSKQRKNNDYTTMYVIGYGADGLYRVLDIRRDRMNLTMRGETVMNLHRQWQPSLVAYEEYGMQADIEFVKFLQKRDLYEFDVTPLGGSMKKELRILRLVPYFENGFKSVEDGGDGLPKSRIIFPTRHEQVDYQGRSHDLVKDFIEHEYTAFPVLDHDDMLDNLARIVDLEQMNLIVTPSAQPVAPRGNASYRKLGQNNGVESWVTA